MNEALLRLDLEIVRAAATLLDSVDVQQIGKGACIPEIRTMQELESLMAQVKASLEKTEAVFASHNVPLPNPEWKRPSWLSTGVPAEG